ncbi:MAG: bifunctional 2-C-methyl-D-erythritol 4-phosphate cytidylyltransferase/2-C-methyl-D-erythritol 2,4-cyclodiphosphate synthase [Treponemataceae bacterium]|nr:MAG: bifunctional 2-C-methyl-D-erythritol 4-phosphate cytidylyltransferase/2-C-methyl-D-erythritol 2,4-cyclodiphosphate synthase [Treponemataceae bacterium]
MVDVILLAAGSSARFRSADDELTDGKKGKSAKKEFLRLPNGKTALQSCVQTFLSCAHNFSHIVITLPEKCDDFEFYQAQAGRDLRPLVQAHPECSIHYIAGGNTRQKSVLLALEFLAATNDKNRSADDVVLIHDGARPFVTQKVIDDVIDEVVNKITDEVVDSAYTHGAACPAIPAVDTLKIVRSEAGAAVIEENLPRENIVAVQTPQGFLFAQILDAHRAAAKSNKTYTDDTEIWADYVRTPVHITQGDRANIKITYRSDVPEEPPPLPRLAVALGNDRHRLVAGRPLVIGGVIIPSDTGEDAHSDGDVLLHALIDALLGAAHIPGAADIGELFPDTDAKWKNADSKQLVKTVWELARKNGVRIVNIDCVVLLEKPKCAPHRQKIIESIASLLHIGTEQIALKAKTGEKVGCVGSGEVIEAWVNILIQKNT